MNLPLNLGGWHPKPNYINTEGPSFHQMPPYSFCRITFMCITFSIWTERRKTLNIFKIHLLIAKLLSMFIASKVCLCVHLSTKPVRKSC